MEDKIAIAKEMFGEICKFLDEQKFNYGKDEEDLVIYFTMQGDDYDMDFIVKIDERKSILKLMTKIPCEFPDSKKLQGAIVCNETNVWIKDGCFLFDYEHGTVYYCMTSNFSYSLVSPSVLWHMIDMSTAIVDEYNDKIIDVSTGAMSVVDYIKFARSDN